MEDLEQKIEEFKNIQKQVESLKKLLQEDEQKEHILSDKAREDMKKSLKEALNVVDSYKAYFEGIEKSLLLSTPCDYSNLKDKHTKEIIKMKKKDLDWAANEVKELIKHPKLTYLFLEVTLRCNAKCEHCGSSCGYDIPKDEISAEELKKALLEIHEHYGAKNVFLTITGGEPLMRRDLFDIMKYAVGLGFHWGMTTNGMLIDEKMIEKFREANLESISISLDGMKETHESFRKVPGSFDKIMKALKLLQGLETIKSLQVTTVANKKNLNELEDVYQLLKDIGIKEWRVMCIDPIGRASKNDGILLDKEGFLYMMHFIDEKIKDGIMDVTYDCSHYLGLKYEMELRKHPFFCGAGLFIGSILANGDMCVCPNVRDKSLVQGNIKTDSFVDVWENRYEQFRKKRITTNEKCKKCKSNKYCRGDSFHTWNFEEKVPNMCMKELLEEEFIEI